MNTLSFVDTYSSNKGDTGIRDEEWWEMFKKASDLSKKNFGLMVVLRL